MEQHTVLPGIKTTPEFKKQVEQACNSADLTYPAVVVQLLKDWISGKITITEPDPDFVAAAQEAFRSENVQQSLKKLGEKFDPDRTWPNAVKI